jgi:glycosyltransferase involved in cell wall biosynthesis
MTHVRTHLRIALLSESDRVGGAEALMLRMADELRTRGHDLHFFGPAAGTGWLGAQFRKRGFPTEVFRLRRPLDVRCLYHLATMLRRRAYDVVHSHMFAMAVYGAAASRMARVPHVITMHGDCGETQYLRRRVALRWAIRHSHSSVAVSQPLLRLLCEGLGIADDELQVIANGVQDITGDARAFRRELGIGDDELLVVAVGRCDHDKGHIVLCQALDRLPQDLRWRLALVGPADAASPDVEGFLASRSWANRAHILGPRDDIPDILSAADLFAMPSLTEGLPVALLEAMVASLAIVASNVGGIPEAVSDGQEGMLVPPSDPQALATALHHLMTASVERTRLGCAARRKALERFSLAAMADEYERLYTGATRHG